MSAGLTDNDLPGFWKDADTASMAGQKWTLRYSRARLAGILLAALGGALTWTVGNADMAAAVIALGFVGALVSELASWAHQPEIVWYSGRALAESAKTLAWRYSVGADPFPNTMRDEEARDLLRTRLNEVAGEALDNVTIQAAHPVTTASMAALRKSPFTTRRDAYVTGRTDDQQAWYARKANANRKAATSWRVALIVTEVLAVALATLRIFGGWSIDFAGLAGTAIAAGAAWTALKQYSQLAPAYSTAANELAIQADRLRDVSEADWPLMAADAEEAISREHTLWLASRTGRRLVK